MAIYPLLGLISGWRVLWWWLIGVVGRDRRFQVMSWQPHQHDFERSLKNGSDPLPVDGYGFLGGTKVCTRTCTLELPMALPAGISVPVTIPNHTE